MKAHVPDEPHQPIVERRRVRYRIDTGYFVTVDKKQVWRPYSYYGSRTMTDKEEREYVD